MSIDLRKLLHITKQKIRAACKSRSGIKIGRYMMLLKILENAKTKRRIRKKRNKALIKKGVLKS